MTLADNERAALEEIRDTVSRASTWVTGPRATLLEGLVVKAQAVLDGTVGVTPPADAPTPELTAGTAGQKPAKPPVPPQ